MSQSAELSTSVIPYDRWSMFHAGLDWITTGKPSRVYRQPLMYKPHYIATWVVRGSVYKRMGREEVTANAGEWIFQQPGEVISRFRGQYAEVAFSIQWLGKEPLLYPPQTMLWKTGPLPELEEMTTRFGEEVRFKIQGTSHNTYAMRILPTSMRDYFWFRLQFDRWMMALDQVWQEHGMDWQPVAPSESRIVLAGRILENLPLDQPMSVSRIARGCGMSAHHFTRLFRQTYGMAPKEYRMKLKLRQSLHELRATDYEVKEIAHHMGCSHTWFCVWIKKETGKTPTEIRAENWVAQSEHR